MRKCNGTPFPKKVCWAPFQFYNLLLTAKEMPLHYKASKFCVEKCDCGCSLDTGRLNPETYRLFEAVEKRYNIRIEYTFPDAQETMDLVREKGMFSFYEDGHQECCRVRKVGHHFAPKHHCGAADG